MIGKTRKGLGGGHGSGGKLKKLLEGSTIVDLLTLGVLVYNFILLRQAGSSGYGSSSLLQIPSSQEMLAAQLTAVVVGIYVIEAVIDSAGDH